MASYCHSDGAPEVLVGDRDDRAQDRTEHRSHDRESQEAFEQRRRAGGTALRQLISLCLTWREHAMDRCQGAVLGGLAA